MNNKKNTSDQTVMSELVDSADGDTAPHKAHDHFFHAAFEDIGISRQILQTWLPIELTEQCDWETLHLENKNLYNHLLREKIADCIFGLYLKNKTKVKFLIHIEHLTTPKRWAILYSWEVVLEYLCTLRNKSKVKKLPLIIPLIIYQNKNPFPHSGDICDLFADPDLARQYWMKPINIFNICQQPDEVLTAQKDDLAAFTQLVMKYVMHDDFKHPFQNKIVPLMRRLHQSDAPGVKRMMEQAMAYIYKKADYPNEAEFVKIISSIDEHLEETVMSLAQRLSQTKLQEGRLLGRQEGKQEGKKEGEQWLIARMLENGSNVIQISKLTGLSSEEIESIMKSTPSLTSAPEQSD